MLTLNKTALEIKGLSKLLGIFVGVSVAIFLLIELGLFIKEKISPTPPPAPTVAFGKLSPVNFPPSATGKKLTYSLDTVTGSLPTFQDRERVYKMETVKPDLLALDKTQAKVAKVGFTSNGIALSEDTYQWTDQSPLSKQLIMNIFSYNFTLSSSFLSSPLSDSPNNLGNQNDALNTAQAFLLNMSILPNDLDLIKTKSFLFSMKDNTLIPATSISNANVLRVDFFQADRNRLPIYYPKTATSTMTLFVENIQNQLQIVNGHFFHQNISTKFSTYPLKTASQAFSELKNQKAYIASYSGNNDNVSIKNVFLAYLMEDSPQDYLMPIIIFEGSNGFFAYVSAVTDGWINK
ncbi:MAG: hypothetical protein Q7R31_04750 [Candidatus Levybacteria bacterium]|nr:hypothetical protein [Candidatus Levybacteria bacterium]